jgi:hypothetical protein
MRSYGAALGMFLVVSVGYSPAEDSSLQEPACRTPQELFEAYKSAHNDRDWRRLFSLGTRAHQNVRILGVAIAAATSGDRELKSIVKEHGVNWEEFDHEFTDAEVEQLRDDAVAIAARVAKPVAKPAELFGLVQEHLEKSGLRSTVVLEMRNLVERNDQATGDSLEVNYLEERYVDDVTGQTRVNQRRVNVTSHLCFRRIDGKWYVVTKTELADIK